MAYWRKPVLALGLALAVATVGSLAYAQADDAIKSRKDGFQVFRTSAGAIKRVVDSNGPAAEAAAPAQALAAQAAKQVSFFPAGSDKGNTKAKPEIWANMADFTAKMKAAEDAATAIATAAAANNIDGVKAGFGALGAACGACHKAYRND
ncbi:cytochrome c [Ferrovibrio sp.]|uniref:cytochrome c n=1 Tax=Ferrovibrio sp. TaxID=1917215 RepID=UPI0025BC050C|nr:cytochrome c [Ferrovibrio sp.]MBX3456613.1 cytochrome c [Ferrovibrio sp.]